MVLATGLLFRAGGTSLATDATTSEDGSHPAAPPFRRLGEAGGDQAGTETDDI